MQLKEDCRYNMVRVSISWNLKLGPAAMDSPRLMTVPRPSQLEPLAQLISLEYLSLVTKVQPSTWQANRPEQRAAVSVAPGVLEQLAAAEAARKQGGAADPKGGDDEEKISEAMVIISPFPQYHCQGKVPYLATVDIMPSAI